MKQARLLLPMLFWTVVMPGTNFAAAQARPAPQHAIPQSSEKSADQQKDQVGNEKNQASAKEADENQAQSADVARTTAKRHPSASHSKPVQARQARPAKITTNSPRTDTPGRVAPLEQTSSKRVTNIPNKAISHHSSSASPSVVSVNGQQFKNSRDPGARLAASGGPVTSPRGTAAISGTGMKHRP
jgi:hypothetical protein